jgi:signal transduction histidine kinase
MFVSNAGEFTIYARYEWQVDLARPAFEPFISWLTFAELLVALRWLSVAVFFAVALLIAWRKWDNWFALLISSTLMLIAWNFVMSGNTDTWRYPALLQPYADSINFFMEMAFVSGLVLLFYLFPDGRFIPRWLKWIAIIPIITTGLFLYFDNNRTVLGLQGYKFLNQWGWPIFGGTLLAAIIIGLGGQYYRYRLVSSPLQRQQSKWVLFGLTAMLAPIVWGLVEQPWAALVNIFLQIIAFTLIPITIGFSILRYRLWEADQVINRALVYGGLTVLLIGLYIFLVGALGVLFQAGGNLLFSILATGLIAILFNPLRQRLQEAVNRMMYGERNDPMQVLSHLGRQLEETAVPGESLPTLVRTIAQTLKLPYVAIAVLDGDEYQVTADYPQESDFAGEAQIYPLLYESEMIGQLWVTPRAPSEPFNPSEERLLRNIARQASAAVHASQLTSQLQRSRERLITAREEERRRLRHDLHDGLGPQLATVTIKADAAANLLNSDPAATAKLLGEIKTESQDAVQEIRRVVNGLWPAALDQLGLLSALQQYAARNSNGSLRIAVQAPPDLPSLPAAVELAAYRIATEAMANVTRHAQARNCTVKVAASEDLFLQVEDDGLGLPAAYLAGVGISSMRERTAELGGTLRLQSENNAGTHLTVRLPLGESK